ncbi:NAD(P)/FAD-dependent oxidoreductase [Roseibium sp. RKSG952]|uniref:NAD(P)/FAD-dependent oxidoreductase n=1 Tax=Roseibium sp. RKSG952 TaxID=2529384 RepID=UPI0012BD574D|nr:NAD(P)/FAD-dependent oxidoreductase [Roseibium sp. RKSG952]MTH97239.1 NAD(P)/FAD-dependent oxidoreductase [Roseibium sp. RKSG952]
MQVGIIDRLPEIDGLSERWGKSVFHCPYCHGYELSRGRIGVIAAGPMSLHQTELLTEWGDVTLLVNKAFALEPDVVSVLENRGVAIEETAIERIQDHADVRLTDGRVRTFAGLFVVPTVAPSSGLPGEIGCALEETPMGLRIRTNDNKETSVPGIFACGDVSHMPQSVALAVGDGSMTGALLHRSLVWPS